MYDTIQDESSSEKWKFISLFLIALLIFNIGFFVNFTRDFNSQLSTLQTQYTNLHQDFLENQLKIAQLQQRIEGNIYGNQSWAFSYSDVFNLIKDSVVLIKTRIETSLGFEDYSQGSGFIYSNDGYILTNYHVIEDAEEISVTFTNGNITEQLK